MKILFRTSALFVVSSLFSVAVADEKDDLVAKVKSQEEEITRLQLALEKKSKATVSPEVIDSLQKTIGAEVKARVEALRNRLGNLNLGEPNISEIETIQKTAIYEARVELKEQPSNRAFTLRLSGGADGKWIAQDRAELDLLVGFLGEKSSTPARMGGVTVVDLTSGAIAEGELEGADAGDGAVRVLPVQKANRSGPQAVVLGEGEAEELPADAPKVAPEAAPKPTDPPKNEAPAGSPLKSILPSFLKGKSSADAKPETPPVTPEDAPAGGPLPAANSKIPVLKTE